MFDRDNVLARSCGAPDAGVLREGSRSVLTGTPILDWRFCYCSLLFTSDRPTGSCRLVWKGLAILTNL